MQFYLVSINSPYLNQIQSAYREKYEFIFAADFSIFISLFLLTNFRLILRTALTLNRTTTSDDAENASN